MKALVNLDVECDVDDVNGDSEHVWVKIPKETRYRRYMVHKSKVTYPKKGEEVGCSE